jgi:molecular chaperone DnaK
MAIDNKTIGRFHLDGLPPSMRGVPQIEVTFDIDANGIINVSALDKGTNKQQTIRIEASSGLSKEEIAKMKQDAELNSEQDKINRENVDTLNEADSTIFQTEKSIKDLDDKLSEEQKTEINELLTVLKVSYQNKDIEKIKEDVLNINTKFQTISGSIYDEVNSKDFESTNTGNEFSDVNNEFK